METAVRLAYRIREAGEVHEYDCKICRQRGYDQTQACYRLRELNRVRLVHPTDGRFSLGGQSQYLTKDQVWAYVGEMERWWPELNILEYLIRYLNVCPQGMIGNDLERYLEQETLCETYKVGPVSGGLDDWPGLLVDAFRVIRQTHIAVQNEQAKERIAKLKNK